ENLAVRSDLGNAEGPPCEYRGAGPESVHDRLEIAEVDLQVSPRITGVNQVAQAHSPVDTSHLRLVELVSDQDEPEELPRPILPAAVSVVRFVIPASSE